MTVGENLVVGMIGSLAAAVILAVFARLRRRIAREHKGMPNEVARTAGDAQMRAAGAAAYKEGKIQMEQNRLGDALEAFGRALQFAKRPRDELAVRARIGVILLEMGEFPRVLSEFRRCLELAEATGDLRSKAGSLRYLALTHVKTGRSGEAVELYEKAIVLYKQVGTFHQRVDFGADMVMAFLDHGDIKHAARLNARSIRFHFLTGSTSVVVPGVINLAGIYIRFGRYRSALAVLLFLEWFPLWKRQPRLVADIKRNLGVCYGHFGQSEDAMKALLESAKLAREYRFRDLEAVAMHDIANLSLAAGDLEEANMQAELARECFEATGHKEGVAKSLGIAGEVQMRLGDAEGAIRTHKKALAVAESAGSNDSMQNLLYALRTDLLTARRSQEFLALAQSVLSRHPALEKGFPQELLKDGQ